MGEISTAKRNLFEKIFFKISAYHVSLSKKLSYAGLFLFYVV